MIIFVLNVELNLKDKFMDYKELKEEIQQQEIIYGINRDPYAVAEVEGWDVVIPDENQLQLDIDSDDAYLSFYEAIGKMERDTGFIFESISVNPSKSGLPKRHVTLTAKEPMSVWQRIALQYYLHSDPVREGLNCMRVLLKDPYPIAFFELKKDLKKDFDPWDDI